MIVTGIGQFFNVENGTLEDQLTIRCADGSLIAIPISNESAQELMRHTVRGRNGVGNGRKMVHTPVPAPMQEEYAIPAPIGKIDDAGEANYFGGDIDDMPSPVPERRAPTVDAVKAQLGLSRNPADRSGVPSYGISRVDDKGNPILPAAPQEDTMDDEDDPGEQI